MALDEGEEKREGRPADSQDRLGGEIEAQEDDETRIKLLQWYLKMALVDEDDPNIKK